jgi:hypothetical protein
VTANDRNLTHLERPPICQIDQFDQLENLYLPACSTRKKVRALCRLLYVEWIIHKINLSASESERKFPKLQRPFLIHL